MLPGIIRTASYHLRDKLSRVLSGVSSKDAKAPAVFEGGNGIRVVVTDDGIEHYGRYGVPSPGYIHGPIGFRTPHEGDNEILLEAWKVHPDGRREEVQVLRHPDHSGLHY